MIVPNRFRRQPKDYTNLSDEELTAAMAATKMVLLRTREWCSVLEYWCQDDLRLMRKEIGNRLISMCQQDGPLPAPFRRRLQLLIAQRGISTATLLAMIRQVSRGRVRTLKELTEFEGMTLWFALGGGHVAA